MNDIQGRPYAKLSKLKPGDIVIVDAGFTCMGRWQERTVTQADDGLWIRCRSGRHYLNGQADDGEHCIGIYKKEGFKPMRGR